MTTVNRPLLRQPTVLAAIVGVVLVALVWWFAWMQPEAAKLASVRAQQAQEHQQETELTLRLTVLKAEAKQVKAASPFLERFAKAVPADPAAPSLVVQVYRLSVRDGVSLKSVTDDSVSPSASGYSSIPVSLSVQGPHDDVLAFIAGLYGLPRLLTIQSVSLAGAGNLNTPSAISYTASISATVYTTSVPATTAQTSS